jgi:hypothetical protein
MTENDQKDSLPLVFAGQFSKNGKSDWKGTMPKIIEEKW